MAITKNIRSLHFPGYNISWRSFYEGLLKKKLHGTAAKSEDDLVSVMTNNPLTIIRSPNKRQRASFKCDIISTCVLPEEEYDQCFATYTLPDGNCKYNAVSMHLVGDSKLAGELRCRTINEMVDNNGRYMSMLESCMYYDEMIHDNIAKMCSNRRYGSVLEVAACSKVQKFMLSILQWIHKFIPIFTAHLSLNCIFSTVSQCELCWHELGQWAT